MAGEEACQERNARPDAEDPARALGRPGAGPAGEIGNLVLLDERPRGEDEGTEQLADDGHDLAVGNEPSEGFDGSFFLVAVVLEYDCQWGTGRAALLAQSIDRHLDGVLDDAPDGRSITRQRELDADGDGPSLEMGRRPETR